VSAPGRKRLLRIHGSRAANGADLLAATLCREPESSLATRSGDILAAYLGRALCTANQLLMRAPMITTMGPAVSAMAWALRTSQWSVGVVGRGT